MSMRISNDYNRFYTGTERLNSYGSAGNGVTSKDAIVKYEFNTKDKDGNKVMDKMTKEETMKTLNEISSKYGDNVIVEFSGDALAALVENKYTRTQPLYDEDYMAKQAEKNAQFQAELKPSQNLHQIIPNIQTNDKLVKSLDGLDPKIVDTAYDIIKDNLLKRNIGDMTEAERQSLISLGMEKAKYLANNYMDGEKASTFLDAMESIAKYGVNGVTDENGKVTFDIKQGPLVGAPDDYINEFDLMKETDKKAYDKFDKLFQEGVQTNNTSKLMDAMRFMLDWSKDAHKNKTELFEDKIQDFADWKKNVEESKTSNAFWGLDTSSKENFLTTIFEKNSSKGFLGQSFIEKDLSNFFDSLK